MAAWTCLNLPGRRIFRQVLAADDATWSRARGWALLLGLRAAAWSVGNPVRTAIGRSTITAVLADTRRRLLADRAPGPLGMDVAGPVAPRCTILCGWSRGLAGGPEVPPVIALPVDAVTSSMSSARPGGSRDVPTVDRAERHRAPISERTGRPVPARQGGCLPTGRAARRRRESASVPCRGEPPTATCGAGPAPLGRGRGHQRLRAAPRRPGDGCPGRPPSRSKRSSRSTTAVRIVDRQPLSGAGLADRAPAAESSAARLDSRGT